MSKAVIKDNLSISGGRESTRASLNSDESLGDVKYPVTGLNSSQSQSSDWVESKLRESEEKTQKDIEAGLSKFNDKAETLLEQFSSKLIELKKDFDHDIAKQNRIMYALTTVVIVGLFAIAVSFYTTNQSIAAEAKASMLNNSSSFLQAFSDMQNTNSQIGDLYSDILDKYESLKDRIMDLNLEFNGLKARNVYLK